jgi:hypothetical protein
VFFSSEVRSSEKFVNDLIAKESAIRDVQVSATAGPTGIAK